MITHQQVIDWQLDQLESGGAEPMPQAMQEYVNQHPELADELGTLRAFWQQPSPLPEPSPTMHSRFYQSLSEAQQQSPSNVTSIESAQPQTRNVSSPGFGQHWWLQAAVLAIVFVLGMFTGRAPQQTQNAPALAALQQEVASLSTVMAISMLQDSYHREQLSI